LDYLILGIDGKPLDARTTIENGRITLHSRSGRPRSSGSSSRGRNPDYVTAFDAIFDRLNIPSAAIERVLLDSTPAKAFPERERVLATADDFAADTPTAVRIRMRAKMRGFGRSDNMPANEGNQNKKVRIDTSLTDEEVVQRLRAVPVTASTPTARSRRETGTPSRIERLPASELRKISSEHIRIALARINAGDPASNFDLSRDYDVKTGDGRAYSPKKVFGLALEEVLGIEARPGHFSAGWGTPCFDILEEAGLWIVPKSSSAARPKPSPTEMANYRASLVPTDEERTWIEGNPRIAIHLKKERQPGLAAEKRARFISDHGRLFCEHCGLDPLKIYGTEAGTACIEVHHHRTHVADMQAGHKTSLDDLRCLCANCHRVLHRSLALGTTFAIDLPDAGAKQ
jgi:5-methylcytosine-specific restriction protein A